MRVHVALSLLVLLPFAGPGIAQSPWLSPYGDGSCGSGFVPTFHTGGEMPVPGNAGFQAVSENLRGGTAGLFWISRRSAGLSLPGLTLYVDPAAGFGLPCQADGTAGLAGAGATALPLPVPNNLSLVGSSLYLQGFFLDTTTPLALVNTHGLGITFARSVPIEIPVLRARPQYQAHFAGVTAAQADQLGRAIWTANQVAGFSYVKTENFSCGGETHWMVIVLHAQTSIEFCLIPGGSFRMGDIKRSGWYFELPVHWVHIEPFLLARTEVPQQAWQAVMGSNPSLQQGPTLPVEAVDWNDTQLFCAKTGLCLPSEPEWEYACRAGVANCFYFGADFVWPGPSSLGLYAWFKDNSGKITNPVGQKLPNAFGLFDMHGNVWEWCEDNYHDTYDCAPSDGGAWSGGTTRRIMRGGCYGDMAQFCRSPHRYGENPGHRAMEIGFRLSRPLR